MTLITATLSPLAPMAVWLDRDGWQAVREAIAWVQKAHPADADFPQFEDLRQRVERTVPANEPPPPSVAETAGNNGSMTGEPCKIQLPVIYWDYIKAVVGLHDDELGSSRKSVARDRARHAILVRLAEVALIDNALLSLQWLEREEAVGHDD